MSVYIFITIGLFLKSLQVSLLDFKKSDLLALVGGSALGLYFVSQSISEEGFFDPWVWLPIGFSFVVALMYRDRLCPTVSEGLMLVYGLAGFYLYSTQIFNYSGVAPSFITTSALIFFFVYGISVLVAVVTSGKMNKTLQVIHMLLFLVVSVGIGLWMLLPTFSKVENIWELVFLGYISLPLLSSIHYLTFFVISVKDWEAIKEHVNFLEDKFINYNLNFKNMVAILLLFLLLFVTDTNEIMNTSLLVAFFIFLGTEIVSPKASRMLFTPRSVL